MSGAAAAIDRRARPVTLTRMAPGFYDSVGDFVPGGPISVTIKAVVQPISGEALQYGTGKDFKDEPEGGRIEATNILWSRTAVRNNDVITYSAERYRVMHVWPRTEAGFSRAALILLEDAP